MNHVQRIGICQKACKCNLNYVVKRDCLRFFTARRRPTIKSDVWPGMENTRTYVRGYVKYWNHDKGYGVLIDEKEKNWHKKKQCQYYVHYTDIAGLNVPWLTVLYI